MNYFLDTGRFKISTNFKLKKNQEINDKIKSKSKYACKIIHFNNKILMISKFSWLER